jgi:hypothetical protein
MHYLTPEGSATYLDISKRQLVAGIVPWGLFLARLSALKVMCSPSDPSLHAAQRILLVEPETPTDEWPEEPVECGGSEPTKERQKAPPAGDDDVIFRFIPGPQTGLVDWVFHPYDPDFFPSVPHGHFKGKPQPKLDAYLGWAYRGSRQIRREPRAKIVALWNDSGFRVMALAAVNYYLTTFPTYAGWRVKNPRALPRRRRP